jgi:hypothetical protein
MTASRSVPRRNADGSRELGHARPLPNLGFNRSFVRCQSTRRTNSCRGLDRLGDVAIVGNERTGLIDRIVKEDRPQRLLVPARLSVWTVQGNGLYGYRDDVECAPNSDHRNTGVSSAQMGA